MHEGIILKRESPLDIAAANLPHFLGQHYVPRSSLANISQEECSAQTTDTGCTVFSRQGVPQESSFPTPGPDELSKEGTEGKAALRVLGSHWAPQ